MEKWKRVALWFVVALLVLSFAVCQKETQKAKASGEPKDTELSSVSAESEKAEESTEMKESAEKTMEKPAEKPVEKIADKAEEVEKAPAKAPEALTRDNSAAILELEKGGKIVIKFYPEDAPNTVDNFINLAKKGFYDGLNFHRVIKGFMAQGGRAKGTPPKSIKAEFNSPLLFSISAEAHKDMKSGAVPEDLRKSFAENGISLSEKPYLSVKQAGVKWLITDGNTVYILEKVEDKLNIYRYHKHIAGTVAMARTPDPNSATSQFYICFEPQPHLDNDYTVFGQVIDGMDVVNTIEQGDVIKSITIVDKASVMK